MQKTVPIYYMQFDNFEHMHIPVTAITTSKVTNICIHSKIFLMSFWFCLCPCCLFCDKNTNMRSIILAKF